jgi:hypothetical protein
MVSDDGKRAWHGSSPVWRHDFKAETLAINAFMVAKDEVA